jgi:hypothetical protein
MADQSENAKSSSRSNTVILIVGAIIIVALLVVILVLVLGGKKQDNTTAQQQEKRAVVVSQDKAEEIAEEMVQKEYVAPGYYEAVMSTTWTFADGEAESKDAYVENVPSNTNDVYFDLFLADDEEHAIYESPVIPRGEKLENIKLDEKLSAGNYDGLLIYHLVDEEQNPISEVRVGIKLVVEN